ncbi:MAG TPA: Cof-type HAD-IIB family hydrolase [Candidatus Limnocylindrales bacterium]|nr:Cof-type HAD-IIB family hydrolase [Candidatus Limnocylindrales bacterium]
MNGAKPDPSLPIRLLALDIDGTLIGEDLILRERTRHAVATAHRRGVAVALVTGRMASSARGFAEVLGLDGPIVAYQGAVIRAMPEPGSRSVGRLLVHRPLTIDVAREAIEWSRAHDLDPHINHLERFIIRADDPMAEDYSAFLGARAELVDDIVHAVRHPISKILAVGEEPAIHTALPRAQAAFAGRAEVTVSHPRFLEFVAPGVTKGSAVRWLARRLGVEPGSILAIGDQHNDQSMIESVGHGAAMPSAPKSVRLVARYVAPPLSDEGAAQLIEELVLAGGRSAVATARRRAAETTALQASLVATESP